MSDEPSETPRPRLKLRNSAQSTTPAESSPSPASTQTNEPAAEPQEAPARKKPSLPLTKQAKADTAQTADQPTPTPAPQAPKTTTEEPSNLKKPLNFARKSAPIVSNSETPPQRHPEPANPTTESISATPPPLPASPQEAPTTTKPTPPKIEPKTVIPAAPTSDGLKLKATPPPIRSELAETPPLKSPDTATESAPETPSEHNSKLPPLFEAPEPQPKKGIGSSILILGVMLLVCGAAGYGIWFVLTQPQGTEETSTPNKPTTGNKQAAPTPQAPPTNPIEKAKATIAKVPQLSDQEILAADSPEPSPLPTTETAPVPQPLPQASPEPQPELPSYTGPAPLEPSPSIRTSTQQPTPVPSSHNTPRRPLDYSLKESVSDYLADIKIDGYRDGARPKVMLDGTSYRVGDTVHEKTGLVFIGTKSQKLLFKDKNGVVYAKSF